MAAPVGIAAVKARKYEIYGPAFQAEPFRPTPTFRSLAVAWDQPPA